MEHVNTKNLPKIAIVGRPNVGKSTLFNRIVGRRKAIIESVPGITRDRLFARVKKEGLDFLVVDTGGIAPRSNEIIEQLVYRQSRIAINEADAIIFTCDILSGVTYQDDHVADVLKKAGKKVFLVINKVDNASLRNDAYDFYRLGLGNPYAISALHGRGLNELYKDIASYVKTFLAKKPHHQPASGEEETAVRMAIVGRPNVGKSSFINCILNEERLLVNDSPGTTRDSVDVTFKRDKIKIIIDDTAGLKHKRKMKETVEVFSMARAKESIRRCDIALIMMDATVGLTRDDIAVVDYVIKNGKPAVVMVNKSDLIRDLNVEDYKEQLHKRFRPFEWMPIIFTSCRQKKNLIKALDHAFDVIGKVKNSIPTPKINALIEKLQRMQPHPSIRSARPKIFYATQIGISPVKFLLFCANPAHIRSDYLNYIEKNIRKEFGFKGIPISFQLKARGEQSE